MKMYVVRIETTSEKFVQYIGSQTSEVRAKGMAIDLNVLFSTQGINLVAKVVSQVAKGLVNSDEILHLSDS